MPLLNKIKHLLFPGILFLLALFVAYQNYIPGTWLTGWDVLHPEFNFLLNLKRAMFSVWQEYQGLGFLGGNAYPAEIPRILLLMFFDIFLPNSFLRYFWVFLMLLIGPLGTYFFTKRLLPSKNLLASYAASFTAGVFYLLNLSTVQYYFTIFDPFSSFYGFFPWFLWVAHIYLSEGGRKKLILLFSIFAIGASAFYIQTLFIVFGMILSILILDFTIQKKKIGLKRAFFMLLAIFIANAYWILPNAYFTLTKAGITKESKINSYATVETRLMNEEMGRFDNASLLKGFWFNYSNVNEKGEFIYLMEVWRDHLAKTPVYTIGYVIFALVLTGLFIGLIRYKKGDLRFFPVFFFALCYFMLAQGNLPFGPIFTFISDKIPLFSQIFRSVFTKWSVPTSLSYSTGIALFIFWVISYWKSATKYLTVILPVIFCSLFIVVVYPVFTGHLINKYQRLEVPSEYFSLFNYLDSVPEDGRVAYFPIHNFWGWNFHNWGNGTSGFLWYGIKQPFLDRASDVWSTFNESFDLELPDAFYGEDYDRFKAVLDKYDVSYILVDESILAFGDKKELLKYEVAKEVFPKIGLKKVWSEGFLSLFEFTKGSSGNNYVSVLSDAPRVSADMDRARRDVIYQDAGDYITSEKPDYIYPFTNLLKEEIKTTLFNDDKESLVTLKGDLGGVFASGVLKIPPLPGGMKYNTRAHIRYANKEVRLTFDPPIKFVSGKEAYLPYNLPDVVFDVERDSNTIFVALGGSVVKVSKNSESLVYLSLDTGSSFDIEIYDGDNLKEVNIGSSFVSESAKVCWERVGSENRKMTASLSGDILSFQVKDAAGCVSTKIGQLGPDKVLVQVDLPFRSHSLSRPHFCLLYEGINSCINDDVFYATSPSTEWSEVSRVMSVDGTKTYWVDIVARPPDFSGQEWTIDYKLPRISTYALVGKKTIDTTFWNDLLLGKEITIENGLADLGVEVLSRKIPIDFSGVPGQDPTNCDVFKRGWLDKVVGEDGIKYQVGDKGALCDYVYSPNLTTDNPYIYVINGETLRGRPLKFYLFNSTNKRSDLEVIAGPGSYKKVYSMLPWPNLKKGSYTLNLESRSFGETAESAVSDVYVYNIPLEWLAQIYIKVDGPSPQMGDITISKVQKTGTHKYLVNAKGSRGVVTLSQGYDPGWIGYLILNSKCQMLNGVMCNALPFIFGEKLEHVKVNSWANGWMVGDKSVNGEQLTVNSGRSNTVHQSPNTEHKVLIVFWPQYLEFAGFAVLVGGFLWILFGVKDKEHRLKKALKN